MVTQYAPVITPENRIMTKQQIQAAKDKQAAIREVKDLMSVLGVTLKQVQTLAQKQKLRIN